MGFFIDSNGNYYVGDRQTPEHQEVTERPSQYHRWDGEWIDDSAAHYRERRAAEYPPAADYLDGIVKGDADQVAAYINACLVVKEKFPKP